MIARYAEELSLKVIRTYTDAAKSGLHLKNRDGLKQLLKDVVEGNRDYRVILVYDISRWGRFQDTDESAHYEFLCKSAGVPIHYCAETFANDNSMPGLIMKMLKRTMAGEYSRELSIKTRAGLTRLARNGFKPGGQSVYGMRRMLLDAAGEPRQLLLDGERKCVANERVILVPGPVEEVAVVRRVFREFAEEHRSLRSIATRLNDERIPFRTGGTWTVNTVTNLLKQRSYVGTLVWGRTSALLGGRVNRNQPQDWVVCDNAFQPIVERSLFERAQEAFSRFTCNLSDEQMLDRLKTILEEKGKLSSEIIQASRGCPGLTTYYNRIGGLLSVYERLGYIRSDLVAAATTRQRLMLIRAKLIKDLIAQSGGGLEEFRRTRVFRPLLKRPRTGLLISVVLVRCYSGCGRTPRWIVQPPMNERNRISILAFLDETNSRISQTRIFPRVSKRRVAFRISENSQWLNSGLLLNGTADVLSAIDKVRQSR